MSAQRKKGTVVKHVDLKVHGTMIRRVPLRLVTAEQRYGSSVDKFTYTIDIDTPARIFVEHADPSECCKLAVSALEKSLAITWTPMLRVTVLTRSNGYPPQPDRKPDEAYLEVSFDEIEVGERGDEPVLRQRFADGRYSDIWRDNERRRSVRDSARIPATPENREKMLAIVEAVHTLRERLDKLLGQDYIEGTLANVGVLMLPSGSAPSDTATRAPRLPRASTPIVPVIEECGVTYPARKKLKRR